MYANQYGPSNTSPELYNNPFVGDPTTAHARFPDISVSTSHQSDGYPYPSHQSQQQYQPYPSQSLSTGASYQIQSHMTSLAPQSQSQFSPAAYTGPQYPAQGQMGLQPTGIGAFQHTGGFAQQQQYPLQNGYAYPSNSFQRSATPNYPAEFDPYAQRTLTQTRNQSLGQSQPQSSIGPNGVSHPRDLIRVHKVGLEAWDPYSWKQLLNACDALKQAWSARKQQAENVVRQYGGPDPGLFSPDPVFGYNSQVEGWKQVLKDATNNFDTVAASAFQLHEVFKSYRQSGDQASKQRVRESCNAAVKGLPDWPTD